MMTRYSLPADWRDQIRRMYPRITDDHMNRFAIMAEADNIITDAGEPTPAMTGWCRGLVR